MITVTLAEINQTRNRVLHFIKNYNRHCIVKYYVDDLIKCKSASLKRLCTKKNVEIPEMEPRHFFTELHMYEKLCLLEKTYHIVLSRGR